MNPYETACERFSAAVRNYAIAKAEAEAMVQAADDEWNAAQDNLRKFESSPGIPLPQFRRQPPDYSQIPGCGASDAGSHLFDLGTGGDLSNPCVQDMGAQS